MQQLETNAKEMDNICEELQQLEENISDEYDAFSNRLNSQRRQQQEENAKDALKNAKTIDEARKIAVEKETAAQNAELAANANLAEPKKIINNLITKINTKVIQPQNTTPISMSVTIDPTKDVKSLLNTTNVKNSISLNDISNSKNNNSSSNRINSKSPINLKFSDIQDDEFNRFLEDPSKPNNQQQQLNSGNNNIQVETGQIEEDEDGNNPMVAAFKETLDSSDEDVTVLKKQLNKISIPLDEK